MKLIITRGRPCLPLSHWGNRIDVCLPASAVHLVSLMFYRNKNLRSGPRERINETLNSLRREGWN